MPTELAAERQSGYEVADALLAETLALPNATTAYSTGFDLKAMTVKGARLADLIMRIGVPNTSTGDLGDAETLKISIITDTVLPLDASSVVLAADVISMVGGGGIGDLGQICRYKIPDDCPRYLGILMTTTHDASVGATSATIDLLF